MALYALYGKNFLTISRFKYYYNWERNAVKRGNLFLLFEITIAIDIAIDIAFAIEAH